MPAAGVVLGGGYLVRAARSSEDPLDAQSQLAIQTTPVAYFLQRWRMDERFMPDLANSHELFVWNANDLLEAVTKLKEGARAAVEANDKLKGFVDADAVALGQLIQSGAKIAKQVKLLGITGQAYVKDVKGTKYIIFKGNQNLRPNLKGTRYLAENAKVRCFVVGSKDIVEDAAHGTKIAIIAFVAIDIAMECTSDHFSLASLGVRISSDVLQAVISAGAGAAAGVFVAGTLGFPVIITFIIVVAVGFAIGVALYKLDQQYRLTERVRARALELENELKKDVPAARQVIIDAGSRAAALSVEAGHEIKAGFYKIDRFFTSTADMMRAESISAWTGI
jgi:hypothetical protein